MRRLLGAVFISLFLCASLFSQEKNDTDQVIKVDVKTVNLSVLVFDRDRAVRLGRENFRIFEGIKDAVGQTVWSEQDIESFTRYDEQPIALAVMIDSSGSMGRSRVVSGVISPVVPKADKLEGAKNASVELFHAVFRQGKDKGLVSEFMYVYNYLVFEPIFKTRRNFFADGFYYKFVTTTKDGRHALVSTSLLVDQDWTDDLENIKSGIRKIEEAVGATALRDAAFNLASHFGGVTGDFLRVAVILSDGLDSDELQPQNVKFNEKNLTDVVAEFQNRQILVYGVGLYQKSPKDILDVIARATGGQAFYEADSSRLTETFFRIGTAVRSVNFVSYTPADKTPGQRQIRVEVGERDMAGNWQRKNFTVFHRQGYTYK